MLPLEDRLRIALGNGLGVQLVSDEVEAVCRFIVTLRAIANDARDVRVAKTIARDALEVAGLHDGK